MHPIDIKIASIYGIIFTASGVGTYMFTGDESALILAGTGLAFFILAFIGTYLLVRKYRKAQDQQFKDAATAYRIHEYYGIKVQYEDLKKFNHNDFN